MQCHTLLLLLLFTPGLPAAAAVLLLLVLQRGYEALGVLRSRAPVRCPQLLQLLPPLPHGVRGEHGLRLSSCYRCRSRAFERLPRLTCRGRLLRYTRVMLGDLLQGGQ